MVLQLLARRELHFTELALHGGLMEPLDVTFEAGFSRELLEAVLTAEDFRSGSVEAHVPVEDDFVDEGFGAELAFVGFVAGMRRHVNCWEGI